MAMAANCAAAKGLERVWHGQGRREGVPDDVRRLLHAARLRWDLFIWARLIPLFAARDDFSGLLGRVEPGRVAYRGLEAGQIARQVKRALRRPWLMREQRCLREGLLAYRCLKRAGYQPELHFGIDRTSVKRARLAAHCWITLEGQTLLNPPSADYVEIHRVSVAGRAVR